MDISGTMTKGLYYVKKFINRLIDRFDVAQAGARAGVVTFSDIPHTELAIRLSDYYKRDTLKGAVNNIHFASMRTRLDLALKIASRDLFSTANGARKGVPKLLFILSDGRQMPRRIAGRTIRPWRYALPLHRMGVKIVAIGVRGILPIDVGSLQYLTRSSKRVFVFDRVQQIIWKSFIDGIATEYCSNLQGTK